MLRDTILNSPNLTQLLADYDKWVKATGLVAPQTSYYYEIKSMIEHAYEEGYWEGENEGFKNS